MKNGRHHIMTPQCPPIVIQPPADKPVKITIFVEPVDANDIPAENVNAETSTEINVVPENIQNETAALPGTNQELYNCTWVLDVHSLDVPEEMKEAETMQDTDLTITADGQVYGSSAVNRYFGSVTVDVENGTLKFGTIGATRMAGPGMDLETAYFKILDSVSGFKIDDGKLYLLSGDQTVAIFNASSS